MLSINSGVGNGGALLLPMANAASVAGVLSVGVGQVLDGDTNDPNNPVIDNNTVAGGGQVVYVPVTIGGYADRNNDVFDLYRVTLQGPITIVLSIAEPEAGELDLFFADIDGTILKQSVNTGLLEIIETDPEQVGEFIVAVRAFDGASNYVLSLGITTAAATTISALTRDYQFLNPAADFVADEAIVQLKTYSEASELQTRLTSLLTPFGLIQKAVSPSGPRLMALRPDPSSTMIQSQEGHESFPLRYRSEEEAKKAHTLEIIKKLRRHPDVAYAEPNYISHITAVPNDAFFNLQWHYPLINLPQAWDITQGDDNLIIAVIDTGVITTHPDLASRMLRDADGTIIGFDFINDPVRARDGDGIDADPFDAGDLITGTQSSFHGTHVAGTIAAATNNNLGVAGVTWQGKIMPLRVLGIDGGTDFAIAQAILYAAGAANSSGTVPPVRADVINMSLGPGNPDCQALAPLSQTRADALSVARNAGVVVVVSAGNNNCHVPTEMSTFEGVISVSAVDLNGQKAPYSNVGATVDVAAPGGDVSVDRDGNGQPDGVFSTLADDSGETLRFRYTSYQGTSMAAPHVAGVVALMLAVNPNLTPDDINMLLAGTHPDPHASAITRDLGAPGRDDVFGYGLIDAFQAVSVARHIAGGGGTPPPTDMPVLAVSPEHLNFDVATTSLQLLISNTGTASLEVSSMEADVPWIVIDQSAFPTLTITVDRSGLPNGMSLGSIAIMSNGGNKTVPVSVQVQAGVTGGDIGTIYVIILDPETLDTVAQAVTSVTQDYVYQTLDFAAGRYRIVAGSDRDNDGFICDSGEACGVFPLIDSPTVIEVDGTITNIDFPVSLPFATQTEAAMSVWHSQISSGFKRLDFEGRAQ